MKDNASGKSGYFLTIVISVTLSGVSKILINFHVLFLQTDLFSCLLGRKWSVFLFGVFYKGSDACKIDCKSWETCIQIVTPQRNKALRSFDTCIDDSCFSKYLEVMGEGGFCNGNFQGTA
ncbi:hypothetical protein EDD64_12925 [Effusibacillus lacus]|nr:hypothetical protein EDD64_12925 [Effusibacillus lacus]